MARPVPTSRSLTARTARSVLWVAASSGFGGAARFTAQLVTARLLLPEHIGTVGIALIVLQAIDVLSQPGLAAAIIHKRDEIPRALDTAWGVFILRGFALGAITALAAPLAARYWGEPDLVPILRFMALILVIRGFTNTHLIVLQKRLDFRRLATVDVLASGAQLAAVVALALTFRNAWALVAGHFVFSAVRVTASFVVTPDRPRFSLDRSSMRELFAYGRFVTGASVVRFFTGGLDRLVAGKIVGMASLGHYLYGFALANLPVANATPILQRVLFPAMAEAADRAERLRTVYFLILRLVLAGSLPIALTIFLLAEPLVALFYPGWTGSVPVARVLSLYCVAATMAAASQSLLLAAGRPQSNLWAGAARLAILVLALYPATVARGIQGTAIAVVAASGVEAVLLLVHGTRRVGASLAELFVALRLPLVSIAITASLLHFGRDLIGGLGEPPGAVAAAGILWALYAAMLLSLDRTMVGTVRRLIERSPRQAPPK